MDSYGEDMILLSLFFLQSLEQMTLKIWFQVKSNSHITLTSIQNQSNYKAVIWFKLSILQHEVCENLWWNIFSDTEV